MTANAKAVLRMLSIGVVAGLLLAGCGSRSKLPELPPPIQNVFEVEGLGERVVLAYDDYGTIWEIDRKIGSRGTIYIYHPDGRVQFMIQYHGNWRDGIYCKWSVDGLLMERGQYKHGTPVGIWYEYGPSGELRGKGSLGEERVFSHRVVRGPPPITTMSDYAKGPDWETYD